MNPDRTDKPQILYVDDDEANLSSFRFMFRKWYTVHTATSAEAGMELLREHDIPVVISDQRMPGTTGVEFLDQVRAEFPDTVRMILTGYSDIEAIIEAINKCRVHYYLKKPWHEREIRAVIEGGLEIVELQHRNLEMVEDLRNAKNQLEHRTADLEREVKERQRQADELRRSGERLALATRAANVGVWDWEIESNTLIWDDSLYELYSLKKEDFSGAYEAWRQTLHPDDLQRVEDEVKAALAGDQNFDTEFRILRRGEVAHIRGIGTVQHDESGKPVRMLGVNWDVTSEYRAKEQYRRVLQTAIDGFWIVDTEGRFIDVNDAYCAMVGYRREELLQMRIPDIEAIERPEETASRIAKIIETGSDRFETRHRRKDGTIIDVQVSVQRSQERSGTLVVFVQDITSRKAAERELRGLNEELERRVAQRTEELQRARNAADAANQAKSIFLANMSHEIRTPMNAILGFTQLLTQKGGLSPTQTSYLDTISRSGQHLLALINDILEMSKIESGRITLNPVDCDLPGILDDLESMFRIRCEARGLQLVCDRTADFPHHVNTDQAKLRQVLINLLSNAVKFTAAGTVTLRASVIQESAKDDPLQLHFEVEDTGPGIAQEDQGRLFKKFEQTRTGITTGGGTGLGLAISREYVRMLGGDISFTSEVGKGSVFRFSVPVARKSGAATSPSPLPGHIKSLRPGQSEVRVLVVDDNRENRNLARLLLQKVGFQVKEAPDGAEGVALWQQWQPHAVLMDMIMPVMDGYEATRKIKSMPGGRDTPVIAVTAKAFKEDEEEIRAAGADDYVRKPVRLQEVLEKLKLHLGLEYEYTGRQRPPATTKDTSATLVTAADLPSNLRGQLRDASVGADLVRLNQLVEQVAQIAPELADQLRSLVQNFDFEAIEKLFD